ncbi:DUF3558 family protein [Actinokineospora sp. NBRC 105648]|uniref:DUF3558 family protein n=1 Tax=Actinokineospora sp. NBRC 105648 TaxID=3032206 RepID=UPI0025545ADB|nr:DUF3558 family protein [Actinokineospora sp. NBRC 105648]
MRALGAVLAALAVLTGCSGGAVSGSPQAATPAVTTPVAESESATTKSPPTTASGSSALSRIEPCEMFSDSELAQLGVAGGEPADTAKSRGCDWTKSGDYGFGISIRENFSLKDADFQGGVPTPVEIGRHEATELANLGGGAGGCDIYVVITEMSSVQITATASGLKDTAKACAKALVVARMIDPKLP